MPYMPESTDGGTAALGSLSALRAPLWLRVLDRGRRWSGYHIRSGAWIRHRLRSAVGRPIDTEIVRGVRLRMDLRQVVEQDTWWSGRRYERPSADMIVEWPRHSERFFDIGANYGFYSYLVVSATDAHAYAFEPIPALIERMLRVKIENHLDRLHPIPVGVSDRPGELRLHLIEAQTGYSSFGPLPDFIQDEGVPVPVVAFDGWCSDAGIDLPDHPAWVAKVDVEGLECQVLEGMQRALAATAFRGLVVELNEFTLTACGTSSAEVVDFLARHGYVREHHPTTSLNGFFVPRSSTIE